MWIYEGYGDTNVSIGVRLCVIHSEYKQCCVLNVNCENIVYIVMFHHDSWLESKS